MTLRQAPPESPMQALGSCQGAAWLVELRSGAIIAATPAGEACLGLRVSAAATMTDATMTDAAMPALARLRAMAATRGGPKREHERLVYWTPRGAVALVCDVTLIPGDREACYALVEQLGAGSPAQLEDAGPGPPMMPPMTPPLSLVPPADDGAKLKEIARRIRTAQTRLVHGRNEDTPPTAAAARPALEPVHERERDQPAADLLAKLAHELRTPLGAISAAAEIMKDERLGPIGNARYQGYVADIHGSARHALGVVERMLGGAGKKETLEFAEIDPNEIVSALASQMAPLAEAAGLDLAVELAPRVPRLVADATSLRQVLLNLLTNAVKFTPRGGRITVLTAYELAGPLRIEIQDTGKGMSRREIARYVDGAVPPTLEAREGGGFGIGLALVRTLAKANGARLLIESRPGKGTSAAVVFAKDRVVPV